MGTLRRRFAEQRLDSLYDEPRPGAPDEEIAETIRLTLGDDAAGRNPLA
ncbi:MULTISPECIES: hypothetical protein [unclassified Mesorhizobium]|nr:MULTISPECIES: hypothetical protein [Mesorhizobium]